MAVYGQQYEYYAVSNVEKESRAAAPKGLNSYRTQGNLPIKTGIEGDEAQRIGQGGPMYTHRWTDLLFYRSTSLLGLLPKKEGNSRAGNTDIGLT